MNKKRTTRNFRLFLVAAAIVMIWRGIWGLLDHYLFPDNPDMSHVVSILIGLVILLFDDFALTELGKGK
jgi:hypothetical protein